MSTPGRPQVRPLLIPGLALVLVYLFGVGVISVAAVAAKGDGGGGAQSASTTVDVTLTEFKIAGNLTAPAGPVKLRVTNAGTVDHNVSVEGSDQATTLLSAGETDTLDLGTLPEGEVTLFCSVPGHKEAGMTATLTVTAAGSSTDHAGMAAGGSGSSSGSGEMTPEQYAKMDADMLASFKAFPAETKGVGNQILQPTVLPDGTKQFELTAEIVDWEVEPGRVVKAWTFNGTVPGPMLKLDVGDHVRVIEHNKLPVNTDIHWHGLELPFEMDGVAPITQDPIKPGQDFTYEFTVDRPYMGMYHPHLHGQMTVPNGMWGVIQVGPTPIPRNGFSLDGMSVPPGVTPAVDIPMVLNDAGVIGFSLNGKSFPATAPIVVNEGDWVAITYYNEGLQSHPMHLHQFPQLVTAKDGFPLPEPYWVDTLMVAPGERYTVLFQADKKGTWVYHCHILNHAERETGMFGMVTAIVVK
jgi:plastocyanin